MLKQFFCGLFILLAFSGAIILSAEVSDTITVTAKTLPEGNIIGAVSVQTPFTENLVAVTLKGEYTGSPAHNNTEEIPGTSKKWKATASCNGLVFKKGATYYNNTVSYDWQDSSDFVFSTKSTTAAKYTINFSLSFSIAIYKKKSDGTAGEFIRWSPIKTVSATRDIWVVGIDKVEVKLTSSPDTSYITAPNELVALVGSQHTFKVTRTPQNAPDWPNGKPKCTRGQYNATGDIIFNTAIDVGAEPLKFECGNTKTITLTNIKPTLESVDFKNGGVQTINDVGSNPEWKKATANGQGARNEPFCVIKNQPHNTITELNAPKNLTFATTVLLREYESLSYPETFTWQNWPINITTIRTPPNHVYACNITYKWEYSTNGGQQWQKFADSNHNMYVTWAQKLCGDTDFTKEHIHYACTNANLATTVTNSAVYNPACQNYVFASSTGVVNKTASAIYASPGFGSYYDRNAWRFWSTKDPGDCGTLANLAGASLQILGIHTNAPLYAYPTDDNPVTAQSCKYQEEKRMLVVHNSKTKGSHNIEIDAVLVYPGNNYEGFLTVNDTGIKAFTVAPPNGPFASNYYYLEVLRSVTTTQQWVVKGTLIPPNDPNMPAKLMSITCPICSEEIPATTFISNGPNVPPIPGN
ncbi:MAG: hypothetical protein LBP59_02065 [Planctomycetaceae bacterium]|jgi:hypothetical protein|nr:hypothetical protein [Planctomycetaceae bacterium]